MTRGKGSAASAVLLTMAMACRVSGQRPSEEPKPADSAEAPVEPSASVVCLATVDGHVRMYRLHREREWVLTMVSPAAGSAPIDLALPGAAPALSPTIISLAYRGYDGAVTLALDSSAAGASFDLRIDPQVARGGAKQLAGEATRLATSARVAMPPCRIVAP